MLLGRGLPPVYERKPDGAPVPEGREPHWRFRLDHDAPIVLTDLIRGEQRFDPKLLSDPVVRREDGSWLYLLPSVIDDVDLGVTHVVRGEDHVSNSAAQIQMFEALGASRRSSRMRRCWSPPKASYRSGSAPTAPSMLREEGVEPMALLVVLARIGTSQPVEPVAILDALAAGFDFRPFRPGAGAFRPARGRADQCAAAPQARLCRGRRSAAGRRDGRRLAAASAKSRAPRRFRRLARGPARRDRAARTQP